MSPTNIKLQMEELKNTLHRIDSNDIREQIRVVDDIAATISLLVYKIFSLFYNLNTYIHIFYLML